MITLQIISKGENIHQMIVKKIKEGKLKSFELSKRNYRLSHINSPGWINLNYDQPGILRAEVKSKDSSREWQILEHFIGRLTYHFKDNISCINIQFF